MKILIEVEPILLPGNLTDNEYYGFRVVGLPAGRWEMSPKHDLVVRSSDASYPGNDKMREFINSHVKSSNESTLMPCPSNE